MAIKQVIYVAFRTNKFTFKQHNRFLTGCLKLNYSLALRLLPFVAHRLGCLKIIPQRCSILLLQALLQKRQLLLLLLQQVLQALAVGQTNIRPDGRVAGGNAGEIAKAAAGKMQLCLALVCAADLVHISIGHQVRQMAYRGKDGIVFGCAQGV